MFFTTTRAPLAALAMGLGVALAGPVLAGTELDYDCAAELGFKVRLQPEAGTAEFTGPGYTAPLTPDQQGAWVNEERELQFYPEESPPTLYMGSESFECAASDEGDDPSGGHVGAAGADSYDIAPYAEVKGWQVDSLKDAPSGTFLGCMASSEQPSGYLMVGQMVWGWLVRVPADKTEGYEGGVIAVDGKAVDSQFGFAPEGAGEANISDEMVPQIGNGTALTTKINGEAPVTWRLEGSGAMIGKVKECFTNNGVAPGGKAPTSTPAPAAVDSDALRMGKDCPKLGEWRSGGNTTPAHVTFVNGADLAVSVYWLDFEGKPVEYAGLLPGESYSVDTWTDHYWLAKDFDGTCHGGVIIPAPGPSIHEIKP